MTDTRDRMLGGLFGVAMRDALGVPVEFWSQKARTDDPVTDMRGQGSHDQPVGTWSDDTSMMLAATTSLTNGWNPDDMMRNFLRWFNDADFTPWGKVFDVGRTCRKAFLFFDRFDYDALDCGGTSDHSNGNGSLMWQLPVTLFALSQKDMSLDDQVDLVMKTSGMTHAHLTSKLANALFFFVVRQMFLTGNDDDLFTCVQKGLHKGFAFFDKQNTDDNPRMDFNLSRFSFLRDLKAWKDTDRRHVSGDGFVVHTFGAALWSLLNSTDVKSALLNAVNLGDDTDTTGAVTGALTGVWFGFDKLPLDWLNKVARVDDVLQPAFVNFVDTLVD